MYTYRQFQSELKRNYTIWTHRCEKKSKQKQPKEGSVVSSAVKSK